MNAGDLSQRRSTIANRVQNIDNFVEGRGDGGRNKRSRPPCCMIIANGAQRFSRRLHRVTSQRAVNVKIDKARREIVSGKIDSIFIAMIRSLAEFRDLSIEHDDLEAVAYSVRKNATRVGEDHRFNLSNFGARVRMSSENPRARLNCQSRSSGLSIF